MTLSEMKKIIDQKSLEYDIHKKRKTELSNKKQETIRKLDHLEIAKQLVIQVGLSYQNDIKTYIEETVTFAIKSVFGDEYDKFVIDYGIKREQQEVKFYVEQNGKLFEPKADTLCGGIVDVIAFALRVVFWSLTFGSKYHSIILDEPFKNVSKSYEDNVSAMVKSISQMLNIQIIMVTHKDNLITVADHVIQL